MSLTYSDIQPFIDDGHTTAAEIKAAMDVIPLYKNDVWATSSVLDQTDIFDILDANGLLWVQADSQYWHGPLVDQISLINNPSLTQGFGRLLNQLQLNDRIVKCGSIPEVADLLTTLTNISKQILPDKAATIQAEMDSITGGLLWSHVSEEDIQNVLDEKAANDLFLLKREVIDSAISTERDRFNSVESSAKTAYDDIVNPARGRFNAAVSWLSSYNLNDHTQSEIEDYASGILNSDDGIPSGQSGVPEMI